MAASACIAYCQSSRQTAPAMPAASSDAALSSAESAHAYASAFTDLHIAATARVHRLSMNACGVTFARLFVFLRNRSPLLLHAPSAEGVTQRAHNRACASRTRPPSASCTPTDKWFRRDGFMPRLVRCPSRWLSATGSDVAVAERYMSPLRLGENPGPSQTPGYHHASSPNC